ncbi:MAG TPA: DUF3291 domain-containing protein [Blastocatellia bacterium]|nr:DUF3291 domain-containing protein [Blastocatellia bacterium]
MIITVTSVRLRRLWHYFKLTYLALQIVRQTKTQKGFVKMKNTGFGYLHYILSVWESEQDVKNFAGTGAHLAAMRARGSVATEIRTYTYQSDRLPDWSEAKALLEQRGKILSFE